MTNEELRAKIDALCHENRLAWDQATKEAKKREAEIRALKAEMEADE